MQPCSIVHLAIFFAHSAYFREILHVIASVVSSIRALDVPITRVRVIVSCLYRTIIAYVWHLYYHHNHYIRHDLTCHTLFLEKEAVLKVVCSQS